MKICVKIHNYRTTRTTRTTRISIFYELHELRELHEPLKINIIRGIFYNFIGPILWSYFHFIGYTNYKFSISSLTHLNISYSNFIFHIFHCSHIFTTTRYKNFSLFQKNENPDDEDLSSNNS